MPPIPMPFGSRGSGSFSTLLPPLLPPPLLLPLLPSPMPMPIFGAGVGEGVGEGVPMPMPIFPPPPPALDEPLLRPSSPLVGVGTTAGVGTGDGGVGAVGAVGGGATGAMGAGAFGVGAGTSVGSKFEQPQLVDEKFRNQVEKNLNTERIDARIATFVAESKTYNAPNSAVPCNWVHSSAGMTPPLPANSRIPHVMVKPGGTWSASSGGMGTGLLGNPTTPSPPQTLQGGSSPVNCADVRPATTTSPASRRAGEVFAYC